MENIVLLDCSKAQRILEEEEDIFSRTIRLMGNPKENRETYLFIPVEVVECRAEDQCKHD